jgi:deferrochelatase/peroxidase EfeB
MASPLVRKGPLVGDAPRRGDAPPSKHGALESMEPSVAPGPAPVDYADLQGLVHFGHGHMSEACFILLEVADRDAACRWLQNAPVSNAERTDPRPTKALQVAFTREGLTALGVAGEIIAGFSDEFLGGMAGDRSRSRRLGDVGANDPAKWDWGGLDRAPHVLVMVYAEQDGLEAWQQEIKGVDWDQAFRVQTILPTFEMGKVEPFGFADGVSQPKLDWERTLPGAKERADYVNLIALGEVVLGFPNEYGRYTARPLIDPMRDPRAVDLPPAEEVPDRRDLGRNGSYLVFRQLHQDVPGFWRFLDQQANADAKERERLAAAMVGRTREGEPLAPLSHDWIEGVGTSHEEVHANHFTYAGDPHGERCPFGAHVRRANPRSGDMPAGTSGWWGRLLRVLGFKRTSFRDDLIASARFHRILRRGREYGLPLSPEDALQKGHSDDPRGLHFIGLVGNIARQFEFVQNAWIATTKFAGLTDESDPLLGNRMTRPGEPATDVFTMPRSDGPARRINGLPQFVTVRGGGYFFLPGLRALRYIAGAPSTRPIMVSAGPTPTLGFWNPVLLALHRGLEIGLHVERRLEPFFRRGFNRVFREPLASFLQLLINWRRPNEGLGLAEERVTIDEEDSLNSIITSFGDYMRRTYRPGTFERGGNTKTHGIVRAEVIIRDDLPEHMRRGIFAVPRTFPAYVRYSGPGPNLPNDIQDVGFVSMALKIMDVHGPKILDDEKYTQDMMGVCTPTFVTPNTRENAKLQVWSFRNMPVFYFLNPMDPHLLDFFMQALWNETIYNPLGHRYYSCVPYLLGEGQAMMYSFRPKSKVITDIPGVPFGHVPPNYLRDNMVATLAQQDVEFDILVQVQTDPHRMPIENASVRWPEKLSPFVPAATVHIPRQKFDTLAHDAFAKRIAINPWHCLVEHRPLGNQSRARKRMYLQLSQLRQQMNRVPHVEPTGKEELE